MDVGCYCVSAHAAARGGARGRSPRTRWSARAAWTCACPPRCGSPATCSASSTAGSTWSRPRSSRWSAREGSLFLADPWHSRSPRIEIRRPGGKEVVEVAAGRPVRGRAARLRGRGARRAAPSVRPRGRRRAGTRDRRAVRRRGGLNRLPSVRMDGRLRPLGIGEMLDAAIKIFTRNWRTLVLVRGRPRAARADPRRARHRVDRARVARPHLERDRRLARRGDGVLRVPARGRAAVVPLAC